MNPGLDAGAIDTQLSCARYLKWLVDHCDVSASSISLHGWALPYPVGSTPHFLLNGEPFARVDWPLESKGVADVFDLIPGADRCRFTVEQPISDHDTLFPNGFARFDLVTDRGLHTRSYRHAWYQPDPLDGPPIPEGERIKRVIGIADAESYLRGGATTACRIDAYLEERFSKPLSRYRCILDWGCGSARITRHLVGLAGSEVIGADIDGDNVAWCRANIPGARFETVPLRPPTRFEDGQFDLVNGTSVFTHLAEDVQFLWLDELRRITAPGAILLMSIQGPSQMAFVKSQQDLYHAAMRAGIFELGRNSDLDGVLEESDYYRAITHSRDYIYSQWGRYFDVIDVIDSLASNQDLVVLRRRD